MMDVLLFLPLPLSSFLPNVQYHKHLQSCTLLLRPQLHQLQLLNGSQIRLTSCLEFRELGCVEEA